MPADFFGTNQPTATTGRKGGIPLTQPDPAGGGFFGNLFGFVDGVTDVIAGTAEDAARVARSITDFDNPFVYRSDREYDLPAGQRLEAGRQPNRLLGDDLIPGVPNLVLGVGGGVILLALVLSRK